MPYIRQEDIKPITAKTYILKNWEKYNLVDTKEDFIALINILQACDETLDSLHDAGSFGNDEFADIIGGWSDDRGVVAALNEFCTFFSEKEFIDYIMERWQEEEEYEPGYGSDYIRLMTTDDVDGNNDVQITKTDDGYVVRIWC